MSIAEQRCCDISFSLSGHRSDDLLVYLDLFERPFIGLCDRNSTVDPQLKSRTTILGLWVARKVKTQFTSATSVRQSQVLAARSCIGHLTPAAAVSFRDAVRWSYKTQMTGGKVLDCIVSRYAITSDTNDWSGLLALTHCS